MHELERKIIQKVLQHHHWNRKSAARALNISYRALLYKIRDAGLPSNRVARRPEAADLANDNEDDAANHGAAAD